MPTKSNPTIHIDSCSTFVAPTMLPKPNKGKGKGKSKSGKKPKANGKGKHHTGFNNSWSYDCYGYDWYWH